MAKTVIGSLERYFYIVCSSCQAYKLRVNEYDVMLYVGKQRKTKMTSTQKFIYFINKMCLTENYTTIP